ncbi:Rv1733c family protein [Streptomyces sp. CA-111067]|uniref:Rv1733c family protein n=1 Tax=Streptomyces sp. CA-111067 TaxID=3240046 RepID=UPI003D9525FE
MGRRKGRRKLGWQLRRNPLRRRSDVVQTCVGLLTAVLVCLTPLLGWWAGQSVDRTLHHVMRAERAERFLVPATVLPTSRGSRTTDTSNAASKAVDPRHGDLLRWTGRDHVTRTETVPVELEVWQVGTVRVWTGKDGELVAPPLDAGTAATHSVLAGMAAGTAAAGLLLMSRQILLWRLMRRRLESWEREWARVGQDWGRAGADG